MAHPVRQCNVALNAVRLSGLFKRVIGAPCRTNGSNSSTTFLIPLRAPPFHLGDLALLSADYVGCQLLDLRVVGFVAGDLGHLYCGLVVWIMLSINALSKGSLSARV